MHISFMLIKKVVQMQSIMRSPMRCRKGISRLIAKDHIGMVNIKVIDFGLLENGDKVKKFILTSKYMEVVLTNFGASLIGLSCPDRSGKLDDILLGFDSLQGYIDNRYFGSTIGRFANRIQDGKFTLDGTTYQLACNNGRNHLHGGNSGFDRKVWSCKELNDGVQFDLISEDGDEGYPGQVNITVTYTIMNDKELKIVFKATTDKPTVVNLTNHAFINLAGQNSHSDMLDHIMEINSSTYLPHKDGIPYGNIENVEASMDFFSKPKPVGQDISKVDGGYDHNYCLGKEEMFCARVQHEKSGRKLEIYTTQPGVQFYSGNFLNTSGKGGNNYSIHTGFCLEPQGYPNNINCPSFPSSILRPGDLYEEFIIWKIDAE